MAKSDEAPEARHGAYGFRLTGVDGAGALLVPAPEAWPQIELVSQVGPPELPREEVTSEHARLVLRSGGRIEIDRQASRVVYVTPEKLRSAEMVHPYLAPAAAIVGRWLGRESFHAGAFVMDGGVWGVIGERGAGKSSTLAWLALNGYDVVCDDMLILDGDAAFVGPRSVDLRAEAAEHLGTGEPLGIVGERERWRLVLEPLEGELPMRGWIFLSWGERVELVQVGSAERFGRLVSQRSLRLPSTEPEVVLQLSALPGWELRRPQRLESVRDAARELEERLAG